MMINELLEERSMTRYRLAKNSGIPYATVNDICSGKTQLAKCSAETIYKISKELHVSMEDLIEPCLVKRSNFELYKSQICHRVKEMGDFDFIIDTLRQDDITKYYERKWYPECFYLLAMLDYISRLNKIPLCNKYDRLRKCRLKETLYPQSLLLAAAVTKNSIVMDEALKEAIPEFMHFNIIESDIRDVI